VATFVSCRSPFVPETKRVWRRVLKWKINLFILIPVEENRRQKIVRSGVSAVLVQRLLPEKVVEPLEHGQRQKVP
jgi:hypothetical protein